MAAPPSFIKQWSTTPASNGTSPNVVPYGWPEGMAPSTVNDTARQQMADHRYQWQDAEWFCWGDSVSKVSGTVFKIATDVTARYLAERRIKIYDTATMYATILSSSYSAPDTSITVQFDNSENSISASFSAVALGIITPTNQSIPRNLAMGTGNRNIIIGGNFDTNPWQRGTTFTGPATGTYAADRFSWVSSGAGVVNILKTNDGPTLAEAGIYAPNCLHVDVTTADAALAAGDQYNLLYVVEGYDFSHIFGRQYTLSFWHKHTKTGTYCVSFYNNATDQYYIAQYTQDTADTWEKAAITVPAYSTGTWQLTNSGGLYIAWSLAQGSTLGSGVNATWTAASYQLATSSQVNAMDSTSNNFKLALIKLEIGAVATSYPVEGEQEILARCQRYYQKTYAQGTYAGTATLVGSIISGNSATTNGEHYINIPYMVTMRAAPTATAYSSFAGTSGSWTENDNSDKAVSVVNIGDSYATVTGTNDVGQSFLQGHLTLSAEL